VLCKLFTGIDTSGILFFLTLVGKVRIHFIYCNVRCSAIEGILHRYHSCGPMLVLEEVAHDWHLGYLGALGLLGAIR
jgi:hypothetical protein